MYTPVILAVISCAFAAPVIRVGSPDAIAGKWIVKLKGDVTSLAEIDLKASISNKPNFEYSMSGFRGFAGTLSDEELTRLQASDHVRS
jgi:cerevisin